MPLSHVSYVTDAMFSLHRFVQKVFELDPKTSGIPWQPRGYVSKRKAAEMVREKSFIYRVYKKTEQISNCSQHREAA